MIKDSPQTLGVAATLEDRRIRRAFEILTNREAEIESNQIELTRVPAPPFQEQERSRHFAQMLRSAGFAPFSDDLHNVIVPFGDRGSHPVIVGAHLDTVFPLDTKLELRRNGRVLHLPGIADNGAGLVALLWLFRAAKEAGLQFRRPLWGVANVGEEGQGNLRGIRHLFDSRPWGDGACEFIAIDGGGIQRITHQGLGSRRLRVSMFGPGGHSWADFGRPNPVHAMATAIHNFVRMPRSPGASFNVGVIQGGIGVNAIPKEATMHVDLRSTSVDSLDRLHAHLKRCSAESAASSGLELKIESLGERPLGRTPPESALVQSAVQTTRTLGTVPQLDIGSTDANLPMSLGIPALAIGAGGIPGGIHTPEEWFDSTGRDRGLHRLLALVAVRAGLI